MLSHIIYNIMSIIKLSLEFYNIAAYYESINNIMMAHYYYIHSLNFDSSNMFK